MTDAQRIFADNYIKTRNATQSYLVAYPGTKNENTAATKASTLLRNLKVSAYIKEQLEGMHKKTIADASEIMEYYTAMMRGELKDETVLPNGRKVEATVRASDRNNAAERLAKMIGVSDQIATMKLQMEQERHKAEVEAKKNEGVLPDILEAVKGIE